MASLEFSLKKISVVEEDSKIYETIPKKLHQNPDGHCKYNYFSPLDLGAKIYLVGVFYLLVWGFLFCFSFFPQTSL